MGLVQLMMDWTAVRKMKEGLLDALRQTRPGAGISIGGEGSKWRLSDPIVARAIIELLRAHPKDIEATDFGFEVTLMRKPDMHRSMTKESYEDQTGRFGILTADGLSKLGMWAKAGLPAHPYRDGIDEAAFNGTSPLLTSPLLDERGVPVTVTREH